MFFCTGYQNWKPPEMKFCWKFTKWRRQIRHQKKKHMLVTYCSCCFSLDSFFVSLVTHFLFVFQLVEAYFAKIQFCAVRSVLRILRYICMIKYFVRLFHVKCEWISQVLFVKWNDSFLCVKAKLSKQLVVTLERILSTVRGDPAKLVTVIRIVEREERWVVTWQQQQQWKQHLNYLLNSLLKNIAAMTTTALANSLNLSRFQGW